MRIQQVFVTVLVFVCAVSVRAGVEPIVVQPITVGDESNSNGGSFVQIDFTENTYVFEIFWDSAPTGFALLETLELEVGLTLEFQEFSFGNLISGLGYESDYLAADPFPGPGWNYYTRESAADVWDSSQIGVSDRIASAGSWDGWTYGEFPGAAPRAVILAPAPGAAIALLTPVLLRRRRRRN